MPREWQPSRLLSTPEFPELRVRDEQHDVAWVGKTIADLYKSRWQTELFLKWSKQHLKVKRFVGRTKNAVLSQLWRRVCSCCWPT